VASKVADEPTVPADDGANPFDEDPTVGMPKRGAARADAPAAAAPPTPDQTPIWRADNPVGTEALTDATATSPFEQDPAAIKQAAVKPPPADQGPYASAKDGVLSKTWWTGLPSRVESAVTGEGRFPKDEANTPSLFDQLGPKFGQGAGPQDAGSYDVPGAAPAPVAAPTAGEQALMLTYMLGGRPDQIAASALKAYPNSRLATDSMGNPTIQMPDGTHYYISKPGIRAQDVAGAVLPTILGAAAAAAPEIALPIRAAAGWLPSAAGWALRMGAQGAAQAGTEVAKGAVIAGPGGGDTGADPLQVLIAGAGGAGGQAIREIARLWTGTFGAGGKLISSVGNAADTDPVTDSMLTTTGKTLFQNAGRDPGVLTVGQLKALQANVRPVTKALAESAPPAPGMPSPPRAAIEQVQYPDLRLTSGTVSQSQPQLNLENRGLFGEASNILKGNKAANQDAYLGAQRDLVTQLTGSNLADESTQGAALLKAIRDRAQQHATATETAYGKLGPSFTPEAESQLGAAGMRFAPGNSGLILSDVAKSAAGNTPELTPYTQQAIKQIRNLVTLPSNTAMSGYVPNGFNLAEYDQTRRTIQDLVSSAKSAWQSGSATGAAKTDYAMAAKLLADLDKRVDQAPGLGLATGDTSRLGLLRAAQNQRAAQAAFENPATPEARRYMQDVLAKDPRSGAWQTYDGQQAVDSLYGKGELQSNGFTPQILDHLTGQFAQDPAALTAIRTPGVQRLIAGRNPGTWPQDAAPWVSETNRLTRQIQGAPAKDVVGRITTPDQLAQIGRLRDVAQTLGTQRALGTSGTAQMSGEYLRRLARSLPFVRELWNDPQVAAAQSAVQGRLAPRMFPQYRVPMTFPAAPLGGLLGTESRRQR